MRNTQIIEAELKPGEQIIWSAQPKGIIRFRAADIFFLIFCLGWIKAGFDSVIGSFSVPAEQPIVRGAMLVAYSIVMVLVPLWIARLRLKTEAEIRENTDYVVTDKRVLLVSSHPKSKNSKIKSVFFGESFKMALKQEKNEEGSIAFGTNRYPPMHMGPIFVPHSSHEPTPIFEWIENVQVAYDTIKTAQENAS